MLGSNHCQGLTTETKQNQVKTFFFFKKFSIIIEDLIQASQNQEEVFIDNMRSAKNAEQV